MENATKALLMAAGILIAIIVLSLAIVVYGRISGFYQTKQNNISQEQLAAFNSEYSAYDRDDVTGFELVSLINKAIDFNQNKVYGASNTKENDLTELGDGYQAISVSVKVLNNDYNGSLFSNNTTYTYTGKNSGNRKSLEQNIIEMRNLEGRISSSDLTKLTSYSSDFDKMAKQGQSITERVKAITGKSYNITAQEISKYTDYLIFKRGTFECNKTNGMKTNSNGQIYEINFTQKK